MVNSEEKTFLRNGLPPLGERSISKSSSHVPDNHLPAQGIVKAMSLPTITNLQSKNIIWDEFEEENGFNWGTESDIIYLVRQSLREVLYGIGMNKLIKIRGDSTMFSNQKADLYVIVNSTFAPIGVIEVKKPGKGVLDEPEVLGQIYDYMMALKEFQQLQYVYGILTSYEEWRVCWLPDSDEDAKRQIEVPDLITKDKFQLWKFLPTEGSCLHRPSTSSDHAMEVKSSYSNNNIHRIFSCTSIYKHDNTALFSVLTSTICKMAASPVNTDNVDIFKQFSLCISKDKMSWEWRSTKDVRFDLIPNSGHSKFFLLGDMHGGADGYVWLATTDKGIGCVLKMFKGNDAEANARKESRLWNDLWNTHTYYKQLASRWTVVLPYVRPVASGMETNYNPSKDLIAIVTQAVDIMANLGVQHNDLKWSHIATYRNGNNERKAIIFDLTNVSEGIDKTQAKKSMLQQLGIEPMNDDITLQMAALGKWNEEE